LLATYRIVDGHCGRWTPTPTDEASYRRFITRFAQGIGGARAVLFLEMDSLITIGCLTRNGVEARMRELQTAIDTLVAHCPHLVVYLDAGAGDAVAAPHIAALLRRAGVAKIQGFFLNSTHFDWTSREISYGEKISHMTGGKHFVINTGFNGRGPLKPADPVREGNEVLCNPPGRGLGPKPTSDTGYANVDSFQWTTNPGESFGSCWPGQPPAPNYWPAYGEMLVRNAVFAVDSTWPIRRFRVATEGRRHAPLGPRRGQM
jgi:endoglucanase